MLGGHGKDRWDFLIISAHILTVGESAEGAERASRPYPHQGGLLEGARGGVWEISQRQTALRHSSSNTLAARSAWKLLSIILRQVKNTKWPNYNCFSFIEIFRKSCIHTLYFLLFLLLSITLFCPLLLWCNVSRQSHETFDLYFQIQYFRKLVQLLHTCYLIQSLKKSYATYCLIQIAIDSIPY